MWYLNLEEQPHLQQDCLGLPVHLRVVDPAHEHGKPDGQLEGIIRGLVLDDGVVTLHGELVQVGFAVFCRVRVQELSRGSLEKHLELNEEFIQQSL